MLLTKAPGFAAGLAAIAGAALVLSGCSPLTAASAKASSAARPAAHHARATAKQQQTDTLVIEPAASFSPVYGLIGSAKHSIDITMYEFADTTAEHDLAAAARRGVHVAVLLDQRERSS